MDQDAYAKYNKPETGSGPGVYRHQRTDEELWASSHPQADAMVRQGWVYDRPLPKAEERRKVAPTATESVKDVTGVDENKDGDESKESDELAELKKQLKSERAARTRAENKLKSQTESVTDENTNDSTDESSQTEDGDEKESEE